MKANVNAVHEEGCPPLAAAIQKSRPANVDLLIEHGADVNAIEPTMSYSCLHLAVCRSDHATISKLLSRGALVNVTDERGDSALHCACSKGLNVAVVQQLMDSKGDVNLGREHGQMTPLAVAVQKGHADIGSLLIESGALVDPWCIYHAKCNEREGMLEMLMAAGGDVCEPLKAGHKSTVLHLAAKQGQPAVTRWALGQGVDVNATDADQCTALMHAAKEGHSRVVEALTESDRIELDLQDGEGQSALHYAGRAGQQEVFDLLVDRGANEDMKNSKGRAPKVMDPENCCVM
eukprot:TRINITY_DN20183_c0_g1_i2.p1 TRINITY_DN20183_c0_g1~~TRINITY_DN20183_c0_g1_i2.p1  ORF type:complete len:291 (-),score=81.15 TRINITY_DN20183_c0_g1_i2:159-1031(-)